MSVIPTRQEAWMLLNEYNQNEYLVKHALEVEGVMKHFARLLGEEDIERWGIVGLLHDLDYERYPEEHCVKVAEILKVSLVTLSDWNKKKILNPYRLGNLIRYKRSEIENYGGKSKKIFT